MIGVTLDKIAKRYADGPPVLQDISLRIEPGELFFLLGPSGCGKTTLLRILAGFLEPDVGTVTFGDNDVTRLPAEKRDTGLVFQNYALWPHMTVAENVGFGLDVRRMPRAEAAKAVREALELVGLDAYAERRIPALSGGQQQRVALARAIVIRPQLLLLDEPLSNLDAKLRLTMRAEIRRVCKESGLTGIYVTHDQKEALSMADRMAVMHLGRLCQVGTPREVYRRPASRFVADFIGETNFIDVTVTARDAGVCRVKSPLGELNAVDSSPGAPVAVGAAGLICVRPESLRIARDGVAGAAPLPAASAATLNRLSATVAAITYLGESAQYEVDLAGGVRLTMLELRPPTRRVGDLLQLELDADDTILLRPE